MTAQIHLTINEVGGKIVCYCGQYFIKIYYRCYSKVDQDRYGGSKSHSSAEV